MNTIMTIEDIIGEKNSEILFELFEENDSSIVKDYGIYNHDKTKVIVITDDIENSKEHIGNMLSDNLWLVDNQTMIRCEHCGFIYPIEETEIDEDGNVCCKNCCR